MTLSAVPCGTVHILHMWVDETSWIFMLCLSAVYALFCLPQGCRGESRCSLSPVAVQH